MLTSLILSMVTTGVLDDANKADRWLWTGYEPQRCEKDVSAQREHSVVESDGVECLKMDRPYNNRDLTGGGRVSPIIQAETLTTGR